MSSVSTQPDGSDELCALLLHCRRPQDRRLSWVSCDDCSLWFHTACVGWTSDVADPNCPFNCGCISGNQAPNNSRAYWATCHRDCALIGTGTSIRISRHGPINNRCRGSGKPPGPPPPAQGVRPKQRARTAASAAANLADINPEDVLWPGQTIRSLPSGLIHVAAESLTESLQSVCDAPDSVDAWTHLLTWAKRRLLAPPNRLGRSALKRHLREQLRGEGAEKQGPAPLAPRRTHALARAVRSRIDVGDVRGASRIVVNDGKIVEPDHASYEVLLTNHAVSTNSQTVCAEPSPPLSLTLEQLSTALTRTPAGGAPGPDGLRPLALKQLTGPRAGPAREALLLALLNFSNLVLAGSVPPAIRHLFFGANLIAFRKKDGGLRPSPSAWHSADSSRGLHVRPRSSRRPNFYHRSSSVSAFEAALKPRSTVCGAFWTQRPAQQASSNWTLPTPSTPSAAPQS